MKQYNLFMLNFEGIVLTRTRCRFVYNISFSDRLRFMVLSCIASRLMYGCSIPLLRSNVLWQLLYLSSGGCSATAVVISFFCYLLLETRLGTNSQYWMEAECLPLLPISTLRYI